MSNKVYFVRSAVNGEKPKYLPDGLWEVCDSREAAERWIELEGNPPLHIVWKFVKSVEDVENDFLPKPEHVS